MIKKVFRKGGYIIINEKSSFNGEIIEYNFIINHYNKIKQIEILKKDYFKNKGFIYSY